MWIAVDFGDSIPSAFRPQGYPQPSLPFAMAETVGKADAEPTNSRYPRRQVDTRPQGHGCVDDRDRFWGCFFRHRRNPPLIPVHGLYPQMGNFHLHLVSDATGETVTSVARACMVQFEDVHPVQHNWWLVRSQGQVERVIAGIEEHRGIVLYTLVDSAVRGVLEEACRRLKIPCIAVLDPVMGALAGYLQAEMQATPGRQYQLDAEYFARIDAMQFTLSHDDGQLIDDLEDADIVLVGVSRTSKTPTCMYLANRGFKCANYPLVPGVPLPPQLEVLKTPLVVGLTKDPKSLSDIRRARLRFLNQEEESDYAQFEKVREEVAAARRLFTRHGWPAVDVSRRSIEEASATIIQLHSQRKAAREGGMP